MARFLSIPLPDHQGQIQLVEIDLIERRPAHRGCRLVRRFYHVDLDAAEPLRLVAGRPLAVHPAELPPSPAFFEVVE